jgi:hypothetical protein
VSFDLVVLAISPRAGDDDVRAMVRRCNSGRHVEGDLDDGVVAFYEELRGRYPDFPPYGDDSPWMSMPLGVGIDHVAMCLAYGQRSDQAVDLIVGLAGRHSLVIYDPQGDEVIRPARRGS